MPRPHLEFIQCQALPWLLTDATSVRVGVERRQLSLDPGSGASSNLLRYPPDWSMPQGQKLDRDEELFVLDGVLRMGDLVYGPGDYAYLPAGYQRGVLSSEGAVVLTFFEGRCQPANDSQLIEHLASGSLDWGAATEPGVAGPRVGRKELRPDTPIGERTWILSMRASETEPLEVNGVETHPCVEEMFLLSGSFHMPCGVMRAGAYFWRPHGIPHGPMGAREDFVALFRAKEGPFSTEWSNRGAAVPWDQPYQPCLPDNVPATDPCAPGLTRAW